MDKIVLVGFAGSGKNTFGEILVRDYGYVGLSFAESLKDCLSTIFRWDRQMLEGVTKESREWREQVDKWWANKLDIPHFTPRWAMQNYGTEVMRNHFHPDIWVINTEKKIVDLGDRKIVVMDGRFPNEIDMVVGRGGKAVRVKRGPEPWFYDALKTNPADEDIRAELNRLKIHESEWAWIGKPVHRIIDNDGSILSLAERAKAWLDR